MLRRVGLIWTGATSLETFWVFLFLDGVESMSNEELKGRKHVESMSKVELECRIQAQADGCATNCPGTHVTHAEPPIAAKLVPGGHCWHGFEAAFAPATGFTQPVGHSVHAASVVAPAVAPNVPGGHSAHTACADAPVAEL